VYEADGLGSLLFAGLLMNYDRMPKGFKWMQTLSFFHAGYEALLVNELRYLQLVERKVSHASEATFPGSLQSVCAVWAGYSSP
jgi:hypothetical protein